MLVKIQNNEVHNNSEGTIPGHIRKYGSTFYIGIAMVILPYIGTWEN